MEPRIIINGHQLTQAELMTFRVAIEAFASDIVDTGLESDVIGLMTSAAYLRSIDQIRGYMFNVPLKESTADDGKIHPKLRP